GPQQPPASEHHAQCDHTDPEAPERCHFSFSDSFNVRWLISSSAKGRCAASSLDLLRWALYAHTQMPMNTANRMRVWTPIIVPFMDAKSSIASPFRGD